MSLGLRSYTRAVRSARTVQPIGYLRKLSGTSLEVQGLPATIGETCSIVPRHGGQRVLAEVVGVRGDHLALMAYGTAEGLAAGCEVFAEGTQGTISVGECMLGRVVDAFGRPLDGRGELHGLHTRPLRPPPINPMHRPRITRVLETGVRSIDALLPIGQGQRVGIFAGSGVGKSTLLGMIARHVHADVNVIALIGERGREVREFIDRQLGAAGLSRSVVVASASDQPALARVRAAHAALAIAEHFRDAGRHVVLTMDSMTRFAMARREIGLAAGEPPTARGYTPSVFAELPLLCERCGTAASGGSITALMTVLVEGDDLNEPVADHLRALLDGHIVLSRQLAHSGQYPAIDVLQSASRVMPDITDGEHRELAAAAIRVLSLLERNRQLVDIGAYERGTHPALDVALALQPHLAAWMRQRDGGVPAADALSALQSILARPAQGAGDAPPRRATR
jgi:flagellum-specific ATP synthase